MSKIDALHPALKVLLVVTFPAWAVPAMIFGLAWLYVQLIEEELQERAARRKSHESA